MGFHNGKSYSEKTFIEIDVYKCKVIPNIVTADIPKQSNDTKDKLTLSLKNKIPIDLNQLSVEFYGLVELDDFIKFKVQ